VSTLSAYRALVMHYLHIRPSDDIEEFLEQANMALWIEKRLNPKPKDKGRE
jgi:hypothetical protein